MLYLIGLGLIDGDISERGKRIIEEADEIFIEKYTSPINYNIKAKELSREELESESILDIAKSKKVVLLIPGDPLSATTHFQLIQSAIEKGIQWDVIHSSSIFTAVAETGLHLYRFGKTTTIPKPLENYNPTSYIDVIVQNDTIDAHTLLLIDPELDSDKAVELVILNGIKEDRVGILCSNLGRPDRIIKVGQLHDLKVKLKKPNCLIIPNPNKIEMEALKIWQREEEEKS